MLMCIVDIVLYEFITYVIALACLFADKYRQPLHIKTIITSNNILSKR
jgi:hypothetical protein